MQRRCAPLAPVTRACGQVLPPVHHHSCHSDRCLVTRERSVHRSPRGLDGNRRLASIPSTFADPGVAFYVHGRLLRNVLFENAARYAWKRSPFHSIEDWWNTILSITKRVQEGISTLESKSSSSGPSTPVSCKTLAYAPLEAIVAMARVRAQHSILCKRKRRHPVEAHALGGILRQSCAGSAAAAATKQRQTCLSIGVDDLDTIKSVQLCA
jgi:hypothetical protein